MKKVILGLAVVASSMTFAQQFGAKAGANFSSISDEGYSESKSKVGFYAGFFMNAPLTDKLNIQPEVLYNNMGATVTSIKAPITNATYETKLNLDYIAVPVMFQYNATPEFFLEAGPQFSFLVNASGDVKSGDVKTTYKVNKDDYNNFDFALGVGAGFWFTPNIGINARYLAGFTDITKNGTTFNNDGSNKNNGFQLGLNYRF